MIVHKSLQSSLRVFCSCGPQETNVNSEEMKDKFFLDCGADQECVLGRCIPIFSLPYAQVNSN